MLLNLWLKHMHGILLLVLLWRLLLLGIHGSLVAAVLGVDGRRGTENLDWTIVSADGNHVVAPGATVLGIFEPAGEAGQAGEANTEEAEEGTDNSVREWH